MAEFELDTPIITDTPTIKVTLSREKPLPIGRHIFQLVVEDEAENPSQPDRVTVIVADTEAPTAVLKAPPKVNIGESFTLDGSQSFDAGGGNVVKWTWTYLGPLGLG